ncbi:hypothetical protein M413DRAFT_449767 [Hebeloma cylindrosporum]|uniref:Nephrocystin 3-like N-terminal domain-containing protein n=1 Tax=Hebeloma cylindrosporum TaxID=76867 RepID=A0A0C3BF33_HEBCY|nr:hypothetical protein M413DRAFT_449767 [Hebeloma cylindrosporum h7]
MFSGNVLVTGGTFIQSGVSDKMAAFDLLYNATAYSALHNSGERFDPPRCHPNTRVAVLDRIMIWAEGHENGEEAQIIWMFGPVGTGKSAIAQTIAERCLAAGLLLAAFFFSRSDATRNHPGSLVATLAYQIRTHIVGFEDLIESYISQDPLIFTKSFETQLLALIIKPLQTMSASGGLQDIDKASPQLIIIDGLDECRDSDAQSNIIAVISRALQNHKIRLKILIASRPEQSISFAFNSLNHTNLTTRLPLDNTYLPQRDIRILLEDKFNRIKATHPMKAYIPASWPTPQTIDNLVERSSGQFIYVSTLVNFISSIRHRPTDRLEIALGLHPPRRQLPFVELDALYAQILSSVEDIEATLKILSYVILSPFHYQNYVSCIENFFDLPDGEVYLTLSELEGVVIKISPSGSHGYYYDCISVQHASFTEFIFDALRSKEFFINSTESHTSFAIQCLRNLTKSGCAVTAFRDSFNSLNYYLSKANPTPDLRSAIYDLSLESIIKRRGGADKQFSSVFVPGFLSNIESLGFKDANELCSKHRMWIEHQKNGDERQGCPMMMRRISGTTLEICRHLLGDMTLKK